MRRLFHIPLLLLFAACSNDGGGGSGMGGIEILATDAPMDPSMVDSARIEVTKIRMHRETEDELDSGWVTIFDGPPVEVELDRLRNGITEVVASGSLEAGSYRQVRIHIGGGTLLLDNGNEYSSDAGNLDFPSAMTSSGYKVFLDPPVEIPAGGVEQVLIDFDLAKTFEPVPANDPENARRYKLHPVVRGAVTSISGEIRATVRRDDGMGTLVGVPDAMVYVLPPGEPDPANAVASSITDATGSAAVLGLLPGTYDVLAREGGTEDRVDGNVVVTGEATQVDLVLP